MRPLSATESFAPAFDRTKAVLLRPFRFGRSWKLAATAYLTLAGSIFLPTPLVYLFVHPPATGPRAAAIFHALMPVIALVGTALVAAFFYIGARLQFARFDIVLRFEQKVAPLWHRYAPFTWRWIGLKLALSGLALLFLGVPLGILYHRLVSAQFVPGQRLAPGFMLHLLLGEALFMFTIFALILASSLLDDFVLPSLALEALPLKTALRRVLTLIETEPGPFFFYVFMKSILAIAFAIAMEIALIVTEMIVLIPLGILAFVGWLALHTLGPTGQILMVVGGIVLLLLFVTILFYVSFLIVGSVVFFFQAYALYFLGGRYPLLGSLLGPPPPTFAPAPYPPPPPADPFPLSGQEIT